MSATCEARRSAWLSNQSSAASAKVGQLLEFEIFAAIDLYDGFGEVLFSRLFSREKKPFSWTACAQRTVVQAVRTSASSASDTSLREIF